MSHRIFLSLFLVVGLFPGSAHSASPAAPTPRTGQTVCFKATGTALIDCAGTGLDGETLTGVAWPDPRFADDGDQTITDRLTGLSWTRDANPAGGFFSWRQALDFIKALNNRSHLGHNDWRLPNINELESLVNKQPGLPAWLKSQGFRNVQPGNYWASSTYGAYTNCAWSVGMYSGILAGQGKAGGGYVWPVRTRGQGVLSLPRTGQTACYDDNGSVVSCPGTGQDGELKTGAPWPTPRFSRNADRTVTDGLTGLVWTGEGNAPGPAACNPGTPKNGQGALDHVKCLNANGYLGRSDWRLPNRNELASLVNRGQSNTAVWLNAQGFSNVQAGGYWSSTTYPYNTWNAWGVNMHDGAVTSFATKHEIHVWPVRGGP